jgi:hypothetical protein
MGRSAGPPSGTGTTGTTGPRFGPPRSDQTAPRTPNANQPDRHMLPPIQNITRPDRHHCTHGCANNHRCPQERPGRHLTARANLFQARCDILCRSAGGLACDQHRESPYMAEDSRGMRSMPNRDGELWRRVTGTGGSASGYPLLGQVQRSQQKCKQWARPSAVTCTMHGAASTCCARLADYRLSIAELSARSAHRRDLARCDLR